jgi:hypothetical protein
MAEKRLITEEEFKRLSEMAQELKLRELFEEPSTYEDDLEDNEYGPSFKTRL